MELAILGLSSLDGQGCHNVSCGFRGV